MKIGDLNFSRLFAAAATTLDLILLEASSALSTEPAPRLAFLTPTTVSLSVCWQQRGCLVPHSQG